MARAPTQYLSLPDGRIAYDDTQGTGRPVLCVPGIGDLRQSTRHLESDLVEGGYRVIRMDLRGLGESSTTFTQYSASSVGSDIVALLGSLNLNNVVVLGNSAGAASAVWAAAHSPDRISGLILTGPFVRDIPISFMLKLLLRVMVWRPWGATVWGYYYKSLYKANPPSDLATYVGTVVENLRVKGRLEAVQAMLAASKADCEAFIGKVRGVIPVIVMMGTADPDFSDPADEAKLIAKAIEGEVKMVEGAGHYPHVEQPRVVLQALNELA